MSFKLDENFSLSIIFQDKLRAKTHEKFIHNKYQEIKFHQNTFDFEQYKISSLGLLIVATTAPQFCESTRGMIRGSIRLANQEKFREDKKYIEKYLVSRNMNDCQKNASKRSNHRQRVRSQHYQNPSTISLKIKNPDVPQSTFCSKDILTFLRRYWLHNNDKLIQQMKSLIEQIHQNYEIKNNDAQKETEFFQVINTIIDDELCNFIFPNKKIQFDSDQECSEIFDNLRYWDEDIPASINISQPLSRFEVDFSVQYICSSNSYLFVLSKDKIMFLYPIYYGKVLDYSETYNLHDYDIDDNTFMFCSTQHLYIKTKSYLLQIGLTDIEENDIFPNEINEDVYNGITDACSNGSSYILFNKEDKSIKYFNEKCSNIYIKNEKLFPKEGKKIYVTDGLSIIVIKLRECNTYSLDGKRMSNFNFFENLEENILKATINSLHEVIFIVTESHNKNIISSYIYKSASNMLINKSYFKERNENENVDYETYGKVLFTKMKSLAFSHVIPEKLIMSPNQLKTFVHFIKVNKPKSELFKALLLILDINLTCHHLDEHILESTKIIKPFLKKLISENDDEETRNIIYGVIVNNVDLFYNETEIDDFLGLFKKLISDNKENNINFIEWSLRQLWYSTFISKIKINNKFIKKLFANEEDNYWLLDFLLICQESLIDSSIKDIKEDPMNFNESKCIKTILEYIKMLYENISNIILQQIFSFVEYQITEIDIIKIKLFTNFLALAPPLLSSCDIASETLKYSLTISELLIYIKYNENNLFEFYFLMVQICAISKLICGGGTYKCEKKFSWLIQPIDDKKINLESITSEIESLYELIDDNDICEFFKNDYDKYKPKNKLLNNNFLNSIYKVLLAVVLHQTNLFTEIKANGIGNTIKSWVLRNSIDIFQLKRTDEKETLRRIYSNIIILIKFIPSLNDFSKNSDKQNEYLKKIENFIQYNDPDLFIKILPKQIQNVFDGFQRFESLYKIINKDNQEILVNGISTNISYQKLDYFLSSTPMNDEHVQKLESFIDFLMESETNIYPGLETLFTILATCKNLHNKAINIITKFAQRCIDKNDPIFYTYIGLALETNTILSITYNFESENEYFMQFILFNIPNNILNIKISRNILEGILKNSDWIIHRSSVKLFFDILRYQIFDENECKDYLNAVKSKINDEIIKLHSITTTFPQIIYGFRNILNQNSNLLIKKFTKEIILTIPVDFFEHYLILIFAIIAADGSDFNDILTFQNEEGKYLSFNEYIGNKYLKAPFTPHSKLYRFHKPKIYETIQEVELNLEESIKFEDVIKFKSVCMESNNIFLIKLYIQTLIRYISEQNVDFSIDEIVKTAKPFTNYYMDYFNNNKLKNRIFKQPSGSFSENEILSKIQQGDWNHYYIYITMKIKNISIIPFNGYIVIRNKNNIYIEIPTGKMFGTQKIINGIKNNINITFEIGEKKINFNGNSFYADSDTIIEFITYKSNIIVSDVIYDYIPNIYGDSFISYNNNIRFDDNQELNVNQITQDERETHNTLLCENVDSFQLDETKDFILTKESFLNMQINLEKDMTNQLISVLIALHILHDKEESFNIKFSFLQSAIVSLIGSDNKLIGNEVFPYDLNSGFFENLSYGLLQSKNVQIIYLALKKLINVHFLDDIGDELIKMAGDYKYHNLLYRGDLIYIPPGKNIDSDENNYVITFSDGSKGKIDKNDIWINDTPLVFLILLWIYIENCSTSKQRINAKLSLIDCWLINSPMIIKYIPQFFAYIQNKVCFCKDDFNETYIKHLLYFYKKNSDNKNFKIFLEIEKEQLKLFLETEEGKLISFNEIEKEQLKTFIGIEDKEISEKFNINEIENNINLKILYQIIQLMNQYETINNFPSSIFQKVYNTIKNINSFYETCLKDEYEYEIKDNVINITNKTNEQILFVIIFKNVKIDKYILESGKTETINFDNVNQEICIKAYHEIKIDNNSVLQNKFALDWKDIDTDEFLTYSSSSVFDDKDFETFNYQTFEMKKLIQKFGIEILQCKAFCIYIINKTYIKLHDKTEKSNDEKEMLKLIVENSHLLQYKSRLSIFNITRGMTRAQMDSLNNFRSNGCIILELF